MMHTFMNKFINRKETYHTQEKNIGYAYKVECILLLLVVTGVSQPVLWKSRKKE